MRAGDNWEGDSFAKVLSGCLSLWFLEPLSQAVLPTRSLLGLRQESHSSPSRWALFRLGICSRGDVLG